MAASGAWEPATQWCCEWCARPQFASGAATAAGAAAVAPDSPTAAGAFAPSTGKPKTSSGNRGHRRRTGRLRRSSCRCMNAAEYVCNTHRRPTAPLSPLQEKEDHDPQNIRDRVALIPATTALERRAPKRKKPPWRTCHKLILATEAVAALWVDTSKTTLRLGPRSPQKQDKCRIV